VNQALFSFYQKLNHKEMGKEPIDFEVLKIT